METTLVVGQEVHLVEVHDRDILLARQVHLVRVVRADSRHKEGDQQQLVFRPQAQSIRFQEEEEVLQMIGEVTTIEEECRIRKEVGTTQEEVQLGKVPATMAGFLQIEVRSQRKVVCFPLVLSHR